MGWLTKGFKNKGITMDDNTLDYFRRFGLDTSNIKKSSDLSEIIYFICLDYLSKTMSKMPWGQYQHTQEKGKEKVVNNELDTLLNVSPNPFYTASMFWSVVELNRLHHGNAYVYIESYRSEIKKLWILPSEQVTVWRDDKGIFGKESNALWYQWQDTETGDMYTFPEKSILHFKNNISFNGLMGIPIRSILKSQIEARKYAEGFLGGLYKSNMFGSKVMVHYTGALDTKGEEVLAQSLERFASKTSTGKFIPMPLGMEAKVLDMKLSDAQFFENNQVSALQLAAAFGMKPNILNDYSKSSYANSETQQLDMYTNTLQAIFTGYEQETTRKLLTDEEIRKGNRIGILINALFKMDNKTQAEVYCKYVDSGIMKRNEVREEVNLPNVDEGDVLTANGNAITLAGVIAGNNYNKNVVNKGGD